MSDVAESGVAAEELKAFVDRIIRLHEEKAGILGDIKDVYAELKGRGFDKTAVGRLVTRLRRDPSEEAERDAMFDLYLDAYERASRTHTHAPAREAA